MKNITKILKYIKPYKTTAAISILFTIIQSIAAIFSMAMVIPFLRILFKMEQVALEPVKFEFDFDTAIAWFNYNVGKIIEESGPMRGLMLVIGLVVVSSFIKTLSFYISKATMIPIRAGIVKDIRNKMYEKITRLHLGYFSEEKKGDIISRMSQDVQEIELSIIRSLELLFKNPIQIIVFLVGMIGISYQLTLFVFIMLPISGLIIGRIGRSLRKTSFKGQRRMGIIISVLEETLGGLRIIKAFNAEDKMNRRFRDINSFYTRILSKIFRRQELASPASEFLGTVVMVIVLWFGASMIFGEGGSLTGSQLIAFLLIFSQIINPAKATSTAYYTVQKGLASLERIDKVLDTEIPITDPEKPANVEGFESTIEYRNVSFKYQDELVLKNVNLTIKKGQTVALVGQSGSGKSTMADLLPRFYDVVGGQILIDGVDIREMKLKDLRSLMGNVNQEPILFNDSFANNIKFGNDDATIEEVKEAARIANANEFIETSKNGYYTNIGDRGGKLSGGQRQRVSIARAILQNPPIMILDEATSALDTESERLVQDAIIKLMKNRTSLVIAHRLSTIKHADEICVMHEGEIVERGTHDELVKVDGHYKKLHEMQIN
jgi:ABC-type multidrug transport system fused ATPase/permease subunit